MKDFKFIHSKAPTPRVLRIWQRLAVVMFAVLMLTISSNASAQVDSTAPLTPDLKVTSPGGVDMRTGNYAPESTDISIGTPENGGITIVRIPADNPVGYGQPGQDAAVPFITNWNFKLKVTGSVSSGKYYTVENSLIGKTFYAVTPTSTYYPRSYDANGVSKLERLSSGSSFYYRYTALDGMILEFAPSADGLNTGPSKLSYTNGITYIFVNDTGGLSGAARLRRVSSNTGYVAIYEYQAASNSSSITKICVFNAATTTPPTTQTCPAGVRSFTYGNNGVRLATITDPLANTSTITSNYVNSTTPFQESLYKPGLSQPWLTNSYTLDQTVGVHLSVSTQQFADGHTFAYAFDYHGMGSEWPGDMAFWGNGWTENGTVSTGLTWSFYRLTPTSKRTVSPGPTKVTDPLGRQTLSTFDSYYSFLDLQTLPSGLKNDYDYNGNKSITKVTQSPATGFADAPLVTQYSYDCTVAINCGKPATKTDAKLNITNYTYDPTHGGLLTATKPADSSGVRPQTRYSYAQFYGWYRNSSGVLTQASPPLWLVTQVSECRTLASCVGTADEVRTTYTYGTSGTANNLLLTQKTVAVGDGSTSQTTTYAYDSEGNKLTEDGPLAGTADTTRWRYDALRRVVGTITPDPDGAGALTPLATRTTFDAAGRATKAEQGTVASQSDTDWATFSPFQTTETDYDLLDRKVKQQLKGSDGVTVSLTQYGYDGFGRPECTAVRMNPAAFTTLPASVCNLGTEGSNGPDRITRNVYDAAGQLLQVRQAVGTPIEQAYSTYTYTPDGKQEYVIDANGNKAKFEYDGFDRQAKWLFPSTALPGGFDASTPATAMATAGAINTADYEQYGYDANNNRTSLRKRDGSTLTQTYDNLNRLVTKVVPERTGLSSTHTRDVYYGYDLFGDPTYARFDSASGEGISFAFDALGRQLTETQAIDGTSRTLTSGHDAANNRVALTYPDGNLVNYYRWAAGAFFYSDLNGSSPLFYPSYDSAGRVSTLYRWGTVAATWNTGTGLSYDNVSRLSSLLLNPNNTTYDATTTFSYNPASQITSSSRSNDTFAWTGQVNVPGRTYTSNGLNQYAAVGGTSFSYDTDGNLTSDGTNSYVYDVENRLVTGTVGGASATLRYDPLGRLYEVNGSTTGITRFLYEGEDLVGEYNSAGTLLRRYVHGIGGSDDPQVWFEGSGVADTARRYLYADERGSVVAVTDSDGNVSYINSYDEYGIPNGSGNDIATRGRFRYTGQAYIPELGMYYYKARMYSPTLGRFMQTDPIGYEDQFNLYAYVGDDPSNGTDPSGESCEESKTCEILVQGVRAAKDGVIDGGRTGWYGIKMVWWGARVSQRAVMAGFTGSQFTAPPVPVLLLASIEDRILREAANGQGNFTIAGSVTEAQADELGKKWVGEGYQIGTTDFGKMRLLSADGLRQYRAAEVKANGVKQANFQSRSMAKGVMTTNGHLKVR